MVVYGKSNFNFKLRELERKKMAKKAKKTANKLVSIDIGKIIPSKKNPRTVNEKAALFTDLVDSITANGVLVPIHVRNHPSGPGTFELLAGERRYRASNKAGKKTIPAINHGIIDDAAAFEITFAENFARQDLTPLEEGQAAVTLLAEYKGDAKAAAAKMGKSVTWIHRHAAIKNKLEKVWRKFLEKYPEKGWTSEHLTMIARLPVNVQKEIAGQYANDHRQIPTTRELEREIDDRMRKISKACWNLDEPIAKRPACTGCIKRTSAQPTLFEVNPDASEAIKKTDKCMDKTCWDIKTSVARKHKVAELKKEHPDLVVVTKSHTTYSQDREYEKQFSKFYEKGRYKTVGKSTKGALPAFVADGDSGTTLKWVKLNDSGSRGGSGSRGTTAGKPTPLAERRKQHESKRWQQVLRKLCEKIEECKYPDAFHRAMPDYDAHDEILKLAIIFGTDNMCSFQDWDDFDKLQGTCREDLYSQLWEIVKPVLVSEITYNGPITQVSDDRIAEAKKTAEVLSIDIDALYQAEVAALPEPKGWASLKADGTPKPVKKKKVAKKKTAKSNKK